MPKVLVYIVKRIMWGKRDHRNYVIGSLSNGDCSRKVSKLNY